MKQFLNEYGFAILCAIVVILLIAMVGPTGNLIQSKVENLISDFATRVDSNIISDGNYNSGSSAKKEIDLKGEWVNMYKFNVSRTEFLNSVELGKTYNINGTLDAYVYYMYTEERIISFDGIQIVKQPDTEKDGVYYDAYYVVLKNGDENVLYLLEAYDTHDDELSFEYYTCSAVDNNAPEWIKKLSITGGQDVTNKILWDILVEDATIEPKENTFYVAFINQFGDEYGIWHNEEIKLVEYQFENEQTWSDWINSEYNFAKNGVNKWEISYHYDYWVSELYSDEFITDTYLYGNSVDINAYIQNMVYIVRVNS